MCTSMSARSSKARAAMAMGSSRFSIVSAPLKRARLTQARQMVDRVFPAIKRWRASAREQRGFDETEQLRLSFSEVASHPVEVCPHVTASPVVPSQMSITDISDAPEGFWTCLPNSLFIG